MQARGGTREPDRTCVGCRRVRSKSALIRLVSTRDGGVAVDLEGTAPGRGAYVCRDERCFDKAVPRLAAALRAGDVDREQVRKDLSRVGTG